MPGQSPSWVLGRAGAQETKPTNHLEWLNRLLAHPYKRARARKTLRMSDSLLDRVANGTLGLSKANWAKLAKALGNPDIASKSL
jgi:hypothetical protein